MSLPFALMMADGFLETQNKPMGLIRRLNYRKFTLARNNVVTDALQYSVVLLVSPKMILLQSILSNMDKEPIILMLQSIKSTASVGPKPHQYIPGDRVLFALEHGLLVRSSTGNLVMTEKGDNLLAGKLNWESL